MSAPTNIIIVLAAVTAGYFIEPIITQRGTKAETSNIQLDLSKVTHEDFPETVELVEDFNISDPSNEINILLPKGSSVKPVKISGEKLVIQHLSIPIESTININKTNFKKLVLPKILARSAQKPATTPGAVVKAESIPETTRETAAGTEPGTVVKTKPIPEPKAVEPVAKTEEIAQVKEEIKPAPVSPPKPEVVKPVNTDPLSEEALIALMKSHVSDGNVKEFSAKQVTKWAIGGPETVDNVAYEQTGRVIFKAVTILGEETHGAIALIKNGEIDKWVWAKNMLSMR